MNIESPNEKDFLDFFLSVVCEHTSPKLVSTVTTEGDFLNAFQVAWAASVAEEAGNYPLIAMPAFELPYFTFYAKSTGFTGYLCFKPTNH
jgi:hypothetical protein